MINTVLSVITIFALIGGTLFSVIGVLGLLRLPDVYSRLHAAGKVGVALTHFNTKSVANMPVPVPPLEEQRAIVDLVEAKLFVIEVLSSQLDICLRRLTALRLSTLNAAFSCGLHALSE